MKIIEYTNEINKYITDYIKFADAKAATLLTFLGVSLGALFSLVKYTLAKSNEANMLNYKMVIFFVFGVVLAFTLLFAVCTILDIFKTIKPDSSTSTSSLNSFPYIASIDSAEKYLEEVKTIDEAGDKISTEYTKHNWEISKVCQDKYGNLSSATDNFKFFIIGMVILLTITTIVLFISYIA